MRRLLERAAQLPRADKSGLTYLEQARDHLEQISRHFDRLIAEAELDQAGSTAFRDSWAEVVDQMDKFKGNLIDVANTWGLQRIR